MNHVNSDFLLACRGQHLEGPVRGPDGVEWHFSVWQGSFEGIGVLKLFFWNDDRTETGALVWRHPDIIGVPKIRDRQRKLATDRAYRARFHCRLDFPIDRYAHRLPA